MTTMTTKRDKIEQTLPTPEDTLAFAMNLAEVIDDGAIIFLYGPLGAGKTTFSRGFLRGLGFTEKVKSPTYTIVEAYDINGRLVYHFDFYRLQDAKELEQIGIHDYFAHDSICLIEWPEKGFPLLPTPDVVCNIKFGEEGREILIEAHTPRGAKLLGKL